jgi:hypothetical protein
MYYLRRIILLYVRKSYRSKYTRTPWGMILSQFKANRATRNSKYSWVLEFYLIELWC